MRTALAAICALLWIGPPAAAQDVGSVAGSRREERFDYYRKWLEEDVVWIISDEERAVFANLTTDGERDQFIEQFWRRRDTDPRTPTNEFKDEHYRRIAYANEKFGSGKPGWKSDRGQAYIAFGPPDIIEDHPSGGWYYRPAHEGGGATSTYPFQLWIYNYIEGIGDQVEIEFVDPSWSGEYRMALEPWEKDALLHAGFGGPTDAELEGSLSKLDRPYFSPGNYRNTRMQRRLGMRMKDKPFERVLRFYKLQAPEPIQYTDLKQIVETRITYNELPFGMGYEYLSIEPDQLLVPVTLEFDNQNLSFEEIDDGNAKKGQVNIYGLVQSMTGGIVAEFDDSLKLEFPSTEFQTRSRRKSVYQKMLVLPPGRFKLTLAVKDEVSGRAGTLQRGIALPVRKEDELDSSSVVLARVLQFVQQVPEQAVPFVWGDFKVVPNITATFNSADDMGVYLQVYNARIDQTSLTSSVDVQYEIWQDGKIVKSYLDPKKNSVLDYGDRLLLLQALDLADLQPGQYLLRISLADEIGGGRLSREVGFTVGEKRPPSE